jgi:spore coat polysaccharide biosynthesis protein SpsF (cytidylyltransferase family)
MSQAMRCGGWFRDSAEVVVAMLVPFDDELKRQYSYKYEIYEGPEDDVLTRYYDAAQHYGADYIVRLTGDCVWLTSAVISKCLREALKRETDYCSNILVRSFMEGLDVEVLSKRALTYLHENMKSPEEREHVTCGLLDDFKRGEMNDFKVHTIFSEYDMSTIKTSIDTSEEYDDAVDRFSVLRTKKQDALRFGSISN